MNHRNVMRGFRALTKLTQIEAAKALKISQSRLSKIEAGKLDMTVDLLEIVLPVNFDLLSCGLEAAGHVAFAVEEAARKEKINKLKKKKGVKHATV